MILNVAVMGGDSAGRIMFARRFLPLVEYSRSVFEVYKRTVPFEMDSEGRTAFEVNQLLCDTMMVNEAMKGLAHMYSPLRLVVHRDTPYDIAGLRDGGASLAVLQKEMAAVYSTYPLDFVFKLGESPVEPSGETIWEVRPEEAAMMINEVCEASGLEKHSGHPA